MREEGESSRKMKQMKVVTSVESDGAIGGGVLGMDVLMNCRSALIVLFIVSVVFLLGVFVGYSGGGPVSPIGTSGVNSNAIARDKHDASGVALVDGFNISAMRDKIAEVRSMLDRYYAAKERGISFASMLKEGVALEYGTKDYDSAVQYISRNMVRVLVDKEEGSKYVIGVIGSSVAAGHDNCNYDNYERQLERLLSPVWEAGGLSIEVRNAGEGGTCGDSHRNQIFCVENMVGEDVDIIHYSWTYFEGPDKGVPQHEMLLRWALMLRKSPSVHILNTGGEVGQCMNDKQNSELFKHYGAKYGFNGVCLSSLLLSNGVYAGKEWGEVGDGVHDTTRYGEKESDSGRKESLGVVWRNWHPGPLGFQLVSDAFAYLHLDSLQKALDTVEQKQLQLQKPKQVTLEDFEELGFYEPLVSSDIGEPLYCEKELCYVDDAPGCLNVELPTYGRGQVSVVSPDDDLNPYAETAGGQLIALDAEGGWKYHIYYNNKNNMIPKKEMYKAECQHLDSCAALESRSVQSGYLVFRLPKMKLGRVAICGCCGKKVAQDMFINNRNLVVEFDGKALDPATFELWPEQKCVKVLDRFPKNVQDQSGHLYLAVKLLNDVKGAEEIKISHVITI